MNEKSLREMFPRISASTVAANPQLMAPNGGSGKQNDVQVNVERRRGIMNKTERAFSMILEAQKQKGEILRWEFEGITLRFSGLRYTPDFVVFDNLSVGVESRHALPRVGENSAESGYAESGSSAPHAQKPSPVSEGWIRVRLIEVKGNFIKGKFERAVERFRHARTYYGDLFQFELWQRQKEGQWKQIM